MDDYAADFDGAACVSTRELRIICVTLAFAWTRFG